MGVSVTLPLKLEASVYAAPAAERVEALWRDVTVRLADDAVTLVSERRSASELTLTWTCALLNEELVVAGTAKRAQLLASLVE